MSDTVDIPTGCGYHWYTHQREIPMTYRTKDTPEPEQTIRLADTSNILRRIAAAMIEVHGEYLCVVEGKRTRIVA